MGAQVEGVVEPAGLQRSAGGRRTKAGGHLVHRHLPAGWIGRDGDRRSVERLAQELIDQSGIRRPIWRGNGRGTESPGQTEPGRKVPERPVTHRQRARQRGGDDFPGHERIMVAEDRETRGRPGRG